MQKSPKQSRTDANIQLSPLVISQRFQMAFPELAALSLWLSGGYLAGAEWTALLDDYVGALNNRQALSLSREAADVMSLGLTGEREVSTLVCSVLGLDAGVLENEGMAATEFLIEVHERLTNDSAPARSSHRP